MNDTCLTTNPTGPARASATGDTLYPIKHTCEYVQERRAACIDSGAIRGWKGACALRARECVCV